MLRCSMLSVRIVSVLTMCVRTWGAGIVSVLIVSVRKGGIPTIDRRA